MSVPCSGCGAEVDHVQIDGVGLAIDAAPLIPVVDLREYVTAEPGPGLDNAQRLPTLRPVFRLHSCGVKEFRITEADLKEAAGRASRPRQEQ